MTDERDGNYCRMEQGRLVRPFSPTPPSTLTTFVHDSFRALTTNEHFSCVGGRAAIRHDAYAFGLYDAIGGEDSSAALAVDLRRFGSDATFAECAFTSFVASFLGPVPASEVAFEELLWTTLRQLSAADDRPWTGSRAADPDSPDFGFSFNGVGLFVIGLHAGSSRVARRFAFPTLVFNPHEQFDRLRRDGKYARFRDVVRARDTDLQGSVNPMVRDFGDASEARQYSGRMVDDQWRCPFARERHSGRDER